MEAPEALATTEEVAAYLQVKTGTLHTWAHKGTGPAYIKIGGARRYDWADVTAWTEARKVTLPYHPDEEEA